MNGSPTVERPPILVTGLRSSAVLGACGEFSWVRESRGGLLDWGGAYAQGIRLTGPWETRCVLQDQTLLLPGATETVSAMRWGTQSRHRVGPLRVDQRVVALENVSGIGRVLDLSSTTGRALDVRLEVELAPFLAPVLLEGVKPYGYRLRTRGRRLSVSTHGCSFAIDSEPLPHHLALNRASWIGGQFEGEVESLQLDYDLTVPPAGSTSVAWVLWGGLERALEADLEAGARALEERSTWEEGRRRSWEAWSAATPQLRLPGAPRVESAYRMACDSLRQLYTQPETGISGLVAGYPWYSAIWCRDLAWMLPAVLWMGDFRWAEAALETVFRFQARADLAVLGGSAGEMPMQLSPGPVFLYGTSDTTLHYPALVRRVVDHEGNPEHARPFVTPIERALAWGRAKTLPSTGLLRHGGEVAAMRAATSQSGSVQFGFDAVDTTIWDSTDRRDHAIDLQVLWARALESAEFLGSLLEEPTLAEGIADERTRLAESIRGSYWWPAEGYLYDSLRTDGTPVRKLRPNALLAASAGLLPAARSRSLVERVARSDLSAAWGVRTLSDLDPGYSPTAYHDGQVWTIATAWAADAALRSGATDRGVSFLSTIAERLIAEGGFANECYRGDRPEPYNSCFLLGFSIAPFLTTIFEALFGLAPDLAHGVLRVAPRIPASWGVAELKGVRLGRGRLDLTCSPERLSALWDGPGGVTLSGEVESTQLTPGVPGSIGLPAEP